MLAHGKVYYLLLVEYKGNCFRREKLSKYLSWEYWLYLWFFVTCIKYGLIWYIWETVCILWSCRFMKGIVCAIWFTKVAHVRLLLQWKAYFKVCCRVLACCPKLHSYSAFFVYNLVSISLGSQTIIQNIYLFSLTRYVLEVFSWRACVLLSDIANMLCR